MAESPAIGQHDSRLYLLQECFGLQPEHCVASSVDPVRGTLIRVPSDRVHARAVPRPPREADWNSAVFLTTSLRHRITSGIGLLDPQCKSRARVRLGKFALPTRKLSRLCDIRPFSLFRRAGLRRRCSNSETPSASRVGGHGKVRNMSRSTTLESEMKQPAKVLFIWDQLGRVGGVETFLYQCLKWLPNYGLAPYVLELRHRKGSQSLQYRTFKDRVIEPPHSKHS